MTMGDSWIILRVSFYAIFSKLIIETNVECKRRSAMLGLMMSINYLAAIVGMFIGGSKTCEIIWLITAGYYVWRVSEDRVAQWLRETLKA